VASDADALGARHEVDALLVDAAATAGHLGIDPVALAADVEHPAAAGILFAPGQGSCIELACNVCENKIHDRKSKIGICRLSPMP